MNKDLSATLAGGAIGLTMLGTTKWETVSVAPPNGEFIKVVVALILMLLGYLMYRGQAKA